MVNRALSQEDKMRNPFPCLWFDGKAEEAARFYTSLLPGSSVDKVWRSPADTPERAGRDGPDGRFHPQ
jgi:predicted 3-demethylubiquinone-9 3-methyltransferase (glyoxalase superfamily)